MKRFKKLFVNEKIALIRLLEYEFQTNKLKAIVNYKKYEYSV